MTDMNHYAEVHFGGMAGYKYDIQISSTWDLKGIGCLDEQKP